MDESLVKLTEQLVLAVVNNKDAVGVKKFETDSDDLILIQVVVDKDDMSKLIGRNGKVVQESSKFKENKLVKINIDSI